MKLLTLVLVAVVATLAFQGGRPGANTSMPTASQTFAGDKPAKGTWGGSHIRADITDNGARFEFDCATGAIDGPIVLDAQGQFEITGTFAAEHGGPVRRDEESSARPARYAGNVKDEEMTLTITDVKTKEVIGKFTLRHGSNGRLMKCL